MEAGPGSCSQKIKNKIILTADSSRFSFVSYLLKGLLPDRIKM